MRRPSLIIGCSGSGHPINAVFVPMPSCYGAIVNKPPLAGVDALIDDAIFPTTTSSVAACPQRHRKQQVLLIASSSPPNRPIHRQRAYDLEMSFGRSPDIRPTIVGHELVHYADVTRGPLRARAAVRTGKNNWIRFRVSC